MLVKVLHHSHDAATVSNSFLKQSSPSHTLEREQELAIIPLAENCEGLEKNSTKKGKTDYSVWSSRYVSCPRGAWKYVKKLYL